MNTTSTTENYAAMSPVERLSKVTNSSSSITPEATSSSPLVWQHATWNPFIGCRKVSPGCAQCYMFRDQSKYGRDPELIRRTSDQTFNAPLRLKQSYVIFTCSWSDFFIEEADAWRHEAWDVIRRTPHHIYQILTKRPERIAECLPPDWGNGWPHVWLGVTAENQNAAVKRLPILLKTPATTRWVCAEPLLGPLDLSRYFTESSAGPGLHWVVTGAETGPKARVMDEDWVRHLRDQSKSAGVPFWYKQNVVKGVRVNAPRLDGRRWDEMPPLPPAVLVPGKPSRVHSTSQRTVSKSTQRPKSKVTNVAAGHCREPQPALFEENSYEANSCQENSCSGSTRS